MTNNSNGTVTIQFTKDAECCYSGNKITKGEQIVLKGNQSHFLNPPLQIIVWKTSKNGNPIAYNYELTHNNFVVKSINC